MTLVTNRQIKTLGRHIPRIALTVFGFLLFWVVPGETRAQGTIIFENRSVAPAINAPVTDARTGQRLQGAAWVTRL
jgi:hypothetical protein